LEPEARAHGTAASGDTAIDANTNQKTGPCGQVTNGRTDRVATYAPGETITVRVREETPHESYIRISLNLDGDDFPLRPQVSTPAETEEVALAAEQALGGDTLLRVYRETNDTPNFVHEIPVTLPNQTCENCTLQVIQFMFATGQTFYFQCADLVIAGDAVAGGDADAGAAPVPATADAGAVTAEGAGGSLGLVPAAPSDTSGSGGSGAASGGPTAVAAPGAGGTAVSGAAGSQSAGTGGGAAASAGDDDGGCSLPASGSSSNRSGLFAVLALGVALLRRRS
jgi:MYXO-CTERM domain-containing protein